NKLTGDRFPVERLPFIAINIETQVLKVPAGYQDYFPAVYGGVSRIKLDIEGVKHEAIETDLDQLESRVTLCFTGAPRNSGINNWEMYKRHIDRASGIYERFEKIRDTSLKIDEALSAKKFDKIGTIFAEEWASRRELAPGITTDFIDQLIELAKQ